MQLLPLTNVNDAHSDFVKVRLNGQDTTGDPSKSLLPADQGQHSPESAEEKKQHYEEMVLSRWPYILTGLPHVFLLLCIGLCVWRCCCRRKRRSRKTKGELLPRSKLVLHASARSGVVREPAAIRWESAQREPQPWWVWCRRSLQWQLIYRRGCEAADGP